MTITSLLSSILRPCGADLAPPKSPIAGSNQIKQQPDENPNRDPNPPVLHPWDADKVTPQSVASPDKSQPTPVLIETKEEDGRVSTSTPRKQDGPPACEASEELVRVFGFDTLHQLHSKAWDDRLTAIQRVSERVKGADIGNFSAEEVFSASAVAAQTALSDRVMPVYMAALELSRSLIVEFSEQHSISPVAVLARADAMSPIIVAKTSDRNQRTVEATHSALIAMARVPALGCRCITAHAMVPVSAKEVATIRGRLGLLELMIDEFGLSKNSGLSLSAVMSWVRPHLEAPDTEVRQGAIDVTVACYSAKGDRTCQYVSNLKPALLKLLEERFAEAKESGVVKKKKSKTKGSRARRVLPALKGQQGQGMLGMPPSRASSRHSTSSNSSGGGRTSSSAGSSEGQRMNPLVTPSRQLAGSRASDGLSLRSPAEDPLLAGRDVFEPPSVHGASTEGGVERPNYVDRTGAPVGGPSLSDYERDLFSLEGDIACADEQFMKEIEGLY